jgi:hypothetical protein
MEVEEWSGVEGTFVAVTASVEAMIVLCGEVFRGMVMRVTEGGDG